MLDEDFEDFLAEMEAFDEVIEAEYQEESELVLGKVDIPSDSQ